MEVLQSWAMLSIWSDSLQQMEANECNHLCNSISKKNKILQITNVSIHLFTNAIINQESICAIDMDTTVHKMGWIIYNYPSPNPVQVLLSENLSSCELFDTHHKAVYYMFQGETATVGLSSPQLDDTDKHGRGQWIGKQ